jgi:hypothetical protein
MKSISLTQGKFADVDDEDYDHLMSRKWQARFDGKNWYAVTRVGSRRVSMHRMIMGIEDPKVEVDHRDGNGLHNWRGNLRVCTRAQNLSNRGVFKNNTTGYKGVVVARSGNKNSYRAQLRFHGKLLYFGFYSTPEQAARAYDAAARKFFGEFARLNFPN